MTHVRYSEKDIHMHALKINGRTCPCSYMKLPKSVRSGTGTYGKAIKFYCFKSLGKQGVNSAIKK
jgi:hypothetical protein